MKYRGYIIKKYEHAFQVASLYGMKDQTSVKWGVFTSDGIFVKGPFRDTKEAKRFIDVKDWT